MRGGESQLWAVVQLDAQTCKCGIDELGEANAWCLAGAWSYQLQWLYELQLCPLR